MKLKDKLKVSFCVMVILPALLLCVFVVGIFKIQSDSICKTYNVEDDTVLLYFYSPMTLFGSITDDVYEQIKEQAEEEPTTFNNRAYLESLGSTLNDRLSELVVRKNNNVIYNSTQYSNTDLARLLPEYETDENNITDVATYRGGIYHSLIKQVDFSDSLGNIYSVSIVTSVKQSIPQIRQMLWQLVFIIIIILVITSLVLNLWIYSSIIKPVNKLKLATDNIKEGSFDFEMPAKAVTLKAMTQDASIEDDEPDIVGPIVIGTTVVVGGAVLGYQAYSLGAEFAGKLMALPYFPSNRSALAMMLWEDAGKPMPESELLYPDVGQEERDMDLQHAARWAMENELIPDLNDEGTAPEEMKFYPDNAVSKLDVLNAWQKAQELKNN